MGWGLLAWFPFRLQRLRWLLNVVLHDFCWIDLHGSQFSVVCPAGLIWCTRHVFTYPITLKVYCVEGTLLILQGML